MAAFGEKIQALMDEAYTEWQKEENKGKGKWDVLNKFSAAHQIAVAFGNFNYQVENGGLEQWIYNGYFHDDAEKLIEYLEIGAGLDARCQTILDNIYKLDQYAQETDCDRYGGFYDEDGDSRFIGDIANCGAFDTWYYENCGEDNWWEVVGRIINKVDEREPNHEDAGISGGEPLVADMEGTIRAYIVNVDDMVAMFADINRLKDGNFAGKWHAFPTTTAELQATLKEIGVDGVKHKEYRINDFDHLSESFREPLSVDVNLDELNFLAYKLSGLTESQREVLEAVLESGKHCESAADVINIMENLDRFELQPAFTPEMYGAFLLETEKDNTSEVFQRLEQSGNPDERAFAKYVLRLEAHIDETDFGRGVSEEENGTFTEHGYLTEREGFKEVYRGPEDIPAEYRVLAYPQPDPPIKVESADLTDLILKMHAVGGEYMHDAHYNLNTLDIGNSAEYLLLLNGRNAFLTEAALAYHRGSTAFDFWLNAVESPDTKAFAIHSANKRNPRGSVIGDIVEIDLAERQRDILNNSIHFTRIDATPKFGPDRSYTPEQWGRMEGIDRDMLGSWTMHFEPDDLRAVKRHLEDIREEHAGSGRIVAPDTVLFNLNDGYMAKAENPQPDMLRINLDVAKDILSHGAPVYRLTPNGPEQLSSLDAMPSRGGLWYQSYREFAVKKDDLGGLDRWADRTADAMIVRWQPERNAPDKSKTRSPEL